LEENEFHGEWLGKAVDVVESMRARGFTLVEMVVALTIIAILLSLAFPAMKALGEDDEPTSRQFWILADFCVLAL
jgi:prepilin-type N-terminal cleavage/methylation domain-containing protein